MSGNKRYYWLKLEEKFFEDDTIQWLEEQKNGKDYVIFYLKLMLKSLQDDGSLIRYVGEKLIPYDVQALAKLTGTNEDTVAVAMKTFVEIGLVEMKDSGEIYMSQITEMVGSETHFAVQKRRQRAVENNRKQISGQCPDNVEGCPPEIEKELDKEIENREDHSTAKAERIPFKEIIDYLNEQTGRRYSHSANKNQDLIKARWNEGFRVEDFKQVIDAKVKDWSNDSKMNQYLRPVTLFSNKFDDYLNQVPTNGGDDGGGSYGGIEF